METNNNSKNDKNWWESADVPQMDWSIEQAADAALWSEAAQVELSRRSNRTHFLSGRAYLVIAAQLKADDKPYSLRAIKVVLEERLQNAPDPQKRVPPSVEIIRRDKFTAEAFVDDPSELDQYPSHLDALRAKDFFPKTEKGTSVFDESKEWWAEDDLDQEDRLGDAEGVEEQEAEAPQSNPLPFPNEDEQKQILADLKKRKAGQAQQQRKTDAQEIPDKLKVVEEVLLDLLRSEAKSIADLREALREAVAKRPDFVIDVRQSLLTIQEQIEVVLGDLPSE